MRNKESIFDALSRSPFRSRFHLDEADVLYVRTKGMETIRRHARDFVSRKLAPASPPNDGRQTPMRGHPVFKAQHACACCCRDCLAKWHRIPKGRELSAEEIDHIVDGILMEWLRKEMGLRAGEEDAAGQCAAIEGASSPTRNDAGKDAAQAVKDPAAVRRAGRAAKGSRSPGAGHPLLPGLKGR